MTRGGSIIVVSSIINVRGIPAHGTYASAKAGVRALVRVWTQELKDKEIRVNTLSPGATETPIIRGQFDSDEASDAAKKQFASITPLGRLGRPEELASAAYFLASDESSYITGIDLPVDGGRPSLSETTSTVLRITRTPGRRPSASRCKSLLIKFRSAHPQFLPAGETKLDHHP